MQHSYSYLFFIKIMNDAFQMFTILVILISCCFSHIACVWFHVYVGLARDAVEIWGDISCLGVTHGWTPHTHG